MKILHTADWHLGHQLHGYDRGYEHQQFLDWLTKLLVDEQVDALLVAGDLFDTANPPASAWRQLYRFLADIRARLPRLDVVLVGGNHDSPSKLDAPHELLRAFDLHLVGAVSRDSDGELEVERLLVPLTDSQGETQAWCAAVPFLRSADLRLSDVPEVDSANGSEVDRLVEGVRRVYQQVVSAAEQRRDAGQALIGIGHAYMRDGQLSELSERKVLGGNQHALPVSVFPDSLNYVALGHLHLAQQVGGKQHVRYSGSPLPLSMSEQRYNHQVLLIELTHGELSSVRSVAVPRSVELLRLPERALPLEQVLAELCALDCEPLPVSRQPLLEVRVKLDKPEPLLREKISEVLADKPVRLAKITPEYTGDGATAADRLAGNSLEELSPEQVFALRYQREYDGEVPPLLQRAFAELVEYAEQALYGEYDGDKSSVELATNKKDRTA